MLTKSNTVVPRRHNHLLYQDDDNHTRTKATTKSQKKSYKNLNLYGRTTLLTKKDEKNVYRGDFRSKITKNHFSLLKEKKLIKKKLREGEGKV